MIKSMNEIEAERNTRDFIMRKSWSTIFENCKGLIDNDINDNLMKELDNFRINRNLFAHGDGTIT